MVIGGEGNTSERRRCQRGREVPERRRSSVTVAGGKGGGRRGPHISVNRDTTEENTGKDGGGKRGCLLSWGEEKT